MSQTRWILLLALIVVCAIATFRTEHMATASGYTLGPSTNVGDTSYAKMLKADTGQGVGYGPPPAPTDNLPPESATRPTCPSGKTFNDECKCCVDGPGNMSAANCPPGSGLWGGQCVAGRPAAPDNYWLPGGGHPPAFPQEPPQCPPRRPFVPGKGCVGSNGKVSQPMCFDGATYIPDPQGKEIGSCGPVPEPKRATQNRAPPAEGPPAGYTSEGTPARVAPAALNGLQLGGPNDGGIGRSSGGSGSASWGGSGVKYPNLLGPNPKKADFPDTNPSAARLTLPSPCQVGADGNTLYSPGCRAPTDLGYFTVPTIPKTEGVPSPFSEDYTVFMK
jgi:hypothetical protein